MPIEIDFGGALDLGEGIAAIGEREEQIFLRLLEAIFVEGSALLQISTHAREDRRGVVDRHRDDAVDPDVADVDARPLAHDDVHAHVPLVRPLDAPRAYLGLVVTARAVDALDAGEVALEHIGIEELEVEHDALRKDGKKPRARGRGDLVRDGRLGHAAAHALGIDAGKDHAIEVDRVDDVTTRRRMRASTRHEYGDACDAQSANQGPNPDAMRLFRVIAIGHGVAFALLLLPLEC